MFILMEKLGTNYGGWHIPKAIGLDRDSVVYSAGAGEDISFDLILSHKYDCNIVILDPTVRAVKHYGEVKDYYATKEWKFSGDIQKDYNGKIKGLEPNFDIRLAM